MYHMISETEHPKEKRYSLSPKKFERQMQYIKNKEYTPISLDDLQKYLNDKNHILPEKPIIVTFDDGYMDNYENALPVLKKYDIPAMVFIVTGFIGKTNNWMRSEGYPLRHLMGWSEIKEIKENGISIGSHTINHYSLSNLDYKEARKEIEESRIYLENKLGDSIHHFAYPFGGVNKIVKDIVRESGYKTACTTGSGFNSRDTNLFELRRLEIFGTDSLMNFVIKLTYGTNDGNLLLPPTYYMKRLSEKLRRAIRWI